MKRIEKGFVKLGNNVKIYRYIEFGKTIKILIENVKLLLTQMMGRLPKYYCH